MATLFRVRGLRIVIYSNDHAPPHCHIVGPGKEAKVALSDDGHPRLAANFGLSRSELADALAQIGLRQGSLLEHWRNLHGDT